MSADGLARATERMREAGMSQLAIAVFTDAYLQLERAETGLIPEVSIAPLTDVPHLADLPADAQAEAAALRRTVVLKPNGGLGTSMGISGPKTALEVRDGLTFLDITARQILALRALHGVELPLLLMNSFRTREATLARLAAYPDLAVDGLPLDFLQSAEPKLRADDLTPVSWPEDPSLEWCPPGHGDVYVALQSTGVLASLRERGFRHAFLANADNLGATCDARIPAWMAAEGIPYVAEVCDRTPNDRKGGHLAVRRVDGQLILRDNAQVDSGDMADFQDVDRHRFFHTNNLWVDLDALAAALEEREGRLGLPLIVNRKTVDPTRKDSTPVIQVESAMGSAIGVIPGARALAVPRERFRPVKTTNELLLLRSDRYVLTEDYRVASVDDSPEPAIDLGPEFTFVADFEARFPSGVPSVRDARSLTVRGDVTFGADIACVGDVLVEADTPLHIPDGSRLSGALVPRAPGDDAHSGAGS